MFTLQGRAKGVGMNRARLQRITRELLELAGELDRAEAGDAALDAPGPVIGDTPGPAALLEMAKAIRAQRRLRHKFFKKSLFGEPAWGMMLELFIADHAGKETSTTSLCLASDVPATTAHRYIAILMDSGLIIRQPHAKDQRQAIVHLSATGREAMVEYLCACTGTAAPAAPVVRERADSTAALTTH